MYDLCNSKWKKLFEMKRSLQQPCFQNIKILKLSTAKISEINKDNITFAKEINKTNIDEN